MSLKSCAADAGKKGRNERRTLAKADRQVPSGK